MAKKYYPVRIVNISSKNVIDKLRKGDKIVRYINNNPRRFKYYNYKRKKQHYTFRNGF